MLINLKRTKEVIDIQKLIKIFPVTAILGPRQCGKTFLAKNLAYDHYFDLENPRDLRRLETPQLTLESLTGLIVIDEVQRKPELFSLLRYLVDHFPKQKYLILGSASQSLIKQSSESLAGRIGFHYLSGFNLQEVGQAQLNQLWLRGGFPRAYFADNDESSFIWLENYIATFLEHDLPQLGINIPAATLRRFWLMLSHYHGQIVNFSELGRSFGVADVTIKNYLDILEKTFMIRLLQPWSANLKKRLVKRPKLYIRDSGLFHALQSINSTAQLFSHIKLGASWEGFALETILKVINKKSQDVFFWQTHSGAEIDLLWQAEGQNWGVEIKYNDAPALTKSLKSAQSDLNLKYIWVIYPGKQGYQLAENIEVCPLTLFEYKQKKEQSND